jgi:hypothetical protein
LERFFANLHQFRSKTLQTSRLDFCCRAHGRSARQHFGTSFNGERQASLPTEAGADAPGRAGFRAKYGFPVYRVLNSN